MNKDKWKKIYNEELQIASDKSNEIVPIFIAVEPENWPELREVLIEHIEAVDKATEVYNMENDIKGESNGK